MSVWIRHERNPDMIVIEAETKPEVCAVCRTETLVTWADIRLHIHEGKECFSIPLCRECTRELKICLQEALGENDQEKANQPGSPK